MLEMQEEFIFYPAVLLRLLLRFGVLEFKRPRHVLRTSAEDDIACAHMWYMEFLWLTSLSGPSALKIYLWPLMQVPTHLLLDSSFCEQPSCVLGLSSTPKFKLSNFRM